ncbi:MAG TPA: hypothetical protein PKA64_25920, partial [Myxococcota bacterium]|nr:hypothetical protein [Myxococcota bacterium]
MTALTCPSCGATAPPSMAACPSCGHLFHGDELRRRVEAAGAYEGGGDLVSALGELRLAIGLVPPGSRQHEALRARIAALEIAAPRQGTPMPAWLAGLGAGGAVLWKLAGPLLVVLSKGKVVLLGLAQTKTLLSLFFTASLYERVGGGVVALLLLGSIYIHEMGHVLAFQRYGIAVSAPMFIPGFGAFVRGSHYPEAPAAQADVALSGPWFGLATGVLVLAAGLALGWPDGLTGAAVIAEMNAFNLIPVWQLDGNRALVVLSRGQRAALGLAGLAVCAPAGLSMGVVAAVGHLLRALVTPADAPGDAGALRSFVGVVIL